VLWDIVLQEIRQVLMLSQSKVEKCRETEMECDESIEGQRLIKQEEEVQEIETRFF
jgi:hypothetical protein